MIEQLSESRIVTSSTTLARISAHDFADMLYLYMCGLRICLIEDADWAQNYLRRTTMWGDYTKWRSNGNDLYVLLYGVANHEDDVNYPLDRKNLHRWLVQAKQGHEQEATTRRIFVRLDHDLLIKDGSMKAMRRLILEWSTLSETNRKLAMTRLLQMFRRKLRRSEMLPRLEKIARRDDLEIESAVDLDDPKRPTAAVSENATSGATGAASVATVVGALGAGFDPEDRFRSIYGGDKKKPARQKPLVIRR